MKEYVCILRNSNLIDLVSIDVVDGRRKGKNDITSHTARHEYGSHNIDARLHIHSHCSSHRGGTELPLRIHQEITRVDSHL